MVVDFLVTHFGSERSSFFCVHSKYTGVKVKRLPITAISLPYDRGNRLYVTVCTEKTTRLNESKRETQKNLSLGTEIAHSPAFYSIETLKLLQNRLGLPIIVLNKTYMYDLYMHYLNDKSFYIGNV